MSLNYLNLDEYTRKFMIEEIDLDIQNNSLYKSPRLTSIGEHDWSDMLRNSAANGTDATLAAQLSLNDRIKESEQRRKPRGGFTTVKVPDTAPNTMAEGEFNRFYIRGLCRRAIADAIEKLVIYRAKEVSTPRRESLQMIGSTIDPDRLLEDLRAHPGIDTAFGLPPGPNSGLSVRLPP